MRVGSRSSSPRVRPRTSTSLSSAQPAVLQEHVPHERVAVGVQAAGAHGEHDVTGAHPARAEQVVGLHDTGGGPRDVVLVGVEEPGVLGGLAADQRAAGDHAGLGDALDDRRDPLGHDPAGGDVVGHEERLGAADDEVVDDHADEVEADGVVDVHLLRDRDLGADAVGGGGEERVGVLRQRARVEEAGEAAEPADHLGATGLLDPALHQVDGSVGRLDGDTGCRVGAFGLGHVRFSTPVAQGLLRTGSAVALAGISSRCLPSRSASGSSIG